MNNREQLSMRFDLRIISSWIRPGATVLDLGCGEGELLSYLRKHKQVRGTGIEKMEAKVARCIEKGLTVLQGDINREIDDYPDDAFDYVILSQTLQQVYAPDRLIAELLRIGRYVIVSFPNFSHWRIRFQLLLKGLAPVSRELPFEWYNTPNIRVITIKDFRNFSKKMYFRILKELSIRSHHHDHKGAIVSFFPNFRATYGMYLIAKTHTRISASSQK